MSDHQRLKEAFEQAGQGHVFRFWNSLNESQREHLARQAAEIDLEEINRLVDIHIRSEQEQVDYSDLDPAPYIALPENGGDAAAWARARETGEAALREGRVAAFTVAGGQGTRLGYDGPKGTFPATPITEKSLFQVFAEKIRAASERYGATIPWFIMTSQANHEQTVTFFRENDCFGLLDDHVHFFAQGRMPAVDMDGKIILSGRDSIAMSPDGHGGSLRALLRSGACDTMREQGIDTISYFQVDNPLVQCIDPAFIGFHIRTRSDMSSKMIPKAYPEEKVGHFCVKGEKLVVVEYSDLPAEMQQQRDEQGNLRYIAGSIAIHIIAREFVEKLGEGNVEFALPFHRANKKVPTIDEQGNSVEPDRPNGVKFEMFVFDALPYARSPIVIETRREDEFSPIKNATGVDSVETSRNDQLRQWARWANAAGVNVPCDDTGLPAFKFEVSPVFADSQEAFVNRWQSLDPKPDIKEGAYLQ